jgi:hypothetical protein
MRGRLVARKELEERTRSEMLRLLGRHFEGVDPAGFRKDLEEKNWAILIEDEAGRLMGFSTMLLVVTTFEDEPLTVIYSGDTIMDPVAWGSSAMSHTWIDSVRRLHHRAGQGRLYWLLLTSGFRTYRFLPVFWREFYPRHDRHTPVSLKRLMDRLAAERFGDRYDPEQGVVRLDNPYVLRPALREVPATKAGDPHVQFYRRANAGHVDGDELVCLTELSDSNLTLAGRRMVRTGVRRRVAGTIAP